MRFGEPALDPLRIHHFRERIRTGLSARNSIRMSEAHGTRADSSATRAAARITLRDDDGRR
jgi:hypothetical protein